MTTINISIIAFDNFTDVDVFLTWDLLKRIKDPAWNVRILAESAQITSMNGLTIPTQGHINEANDSDAVIFASGPGTRVKMVDPTFLSSFTLNPDRQLLGSMCSGALILGALGLLNSKTATTYPTAVEQLKKFGALPVEKPFVQNGNIATAAGCLSAQYLAGWVIENYYGREIRELVIKSIQPVGEGLSFCDLDVEKKAAAARIEKQEH